MFAAITRRSSSADKESTDDCWRNLPSEILHHLRTFQRSPLKVYTTHCHQLPAVQNNNRHGETIRACQSAAGPVAIEAVFSVMQFAAKKLLRARRAKGGGP